jgi:HSP20 family protein
MRRLSRRDDNNDVLNHFQRMFEEMQEMGKNIVPGDQMPVDVRDENGKIVITADVPGVQKEDISLKADEEGLEITAEGSQEIKEENEKYIRKERSQRMYRRKVGWPTQIDTDTVKASYKDGVLEVTAEKEESDGKDIEIN